MRILCGTILTARSGAADDQVGVKKDCARCEAWSADALHERRDRYPGERLYRLSYGGKRRVHQTRDLAIVESCDANVFRD